MKPSKDKLKSPQKPSPDGAGKVVKKKTKGKKLNTSDSAVKKAVAETVAVAAKPVELSAKDIAKIEKKKNKKLAQKQKKLEKKAAADSNTEGANKEVTPGKKAKSKTANDSGAVAATTADNTKTSPAKTTKGKGGKKNKGETTNSEPKAETKPTKKGKSKKDKKPKPDKDEERVKRERDPESEAATIFIGNLPTNTKRVQITKLLASYGTVKSIRLRTVDGTVLFKHKQRKKSDSLNAYVVLDSVENATKALTLNCTDFKGNRLRVTRSSSKTTSNSADSKRTIFVGNLKYTANEQKLREIFSSCGDIEYIRCIQEKDKGCNGVAYVCFEKSDAVGLALELNETLLDDRPIRVERYFVSKLGAKETRDAAAAAATTGNKTKPKQNAKSAAKRINKKLPKENGSKNPKKSKEYRGVKADTNGIKKSKKPVKKTNSQMQQLAKKIAPRPKKAD